VVQVLHRYVLRGDLTEGWARNAIGVLVGFPMERYGHEPLIPRIWELRENLTAYDAAYVALAEGLRAPLVTCDARLANTPGIRASIELIQ
jgi:predicted nucleic acid-binding protein